MDASAPDPKPILRFPFIEGRIADPVLTTQIGGLHVHLVRKVIDPLDQSLIPLTLQDRNNLLFAEPAAFHNPSP